MVGAPELPFHEAAKNATEAEKGFVWKVVKRNSKIDDEEKRSRITYHASDIAAEVHEKVPGSATTITLITW